MPTQAYLKPGSAADQNARAALGQLLRAPEPLDRGIREMLADLIDPKPGAVRKIISEAAGEVDGGTICWPRSSSR